MHWTQKRRAYIRISEALKECSKSKNGTELDEPAYVAAIVKEFSCKFEGILRDEFPDENFRVGGCFIHQKPLAEFCDRLLSKKSPEIGDLLIVYKRIRNSGITYNALLLQAKRLKIGDIYEHKIGQNEQHQLLLYTKWPKFIYRRAGDRLNGRERSIIPKTITSGAQYLLIDENGTSCHPYWDTMFWCAMPADVFVASKSFALQLLDFIEFQTGRSFVKDVPKDSWSQMIWDLLEVSFSSVFNKRKNGYANASRSSDGISEFIRMSKDMLDIVALDGESGISILCIQSKENEEIDLPPQNV